VVSDDGRAAPLSVQDRNDPGAQSRDDPRVGGEHDERDLDCIPAVRLNGEPQKSPAPFQCAGEVRGNGAASVALQKLIAASPARACNSDSALSSFSLCRYDIISGLVRGYAALSKAGEGSGLMDVGTRKKLFLGWLRRRDFYIFCFQQPVSVSRIKKREQQGDTDFR
jgi:hypothetical protein